MLNPDASPFCLGSSKSHVNIPIHINQTLPILIELLRIDLDTNLNETITIQNKEIRKLKKQADRDYPKIDHTSPRILQYPVKETGLYRLQRVVDESKLEVQRRISDTLVVRCPSARTVAAPRDRCKGDLSDFYLQVEATPPLKIRYSKVVNRDDHGHSVLSIHPENLISPLARQRTSGALVSLDSQASIDVSWARSQTVKIPMNESLGVGGGWQYTIDEVQDACGNIANYSHISLSQRNVREQHFLVHERPHAALRGYDSQNPIRVAKGKSSSLPIDLGATGSEDLEAVTSFVSYLFTPEKELLPDQKHSDAATLKEVKIKYPKHGIEVQEPGLYSLQSIRSEFCEGEVLEPSSCVLLNPAEPDLTISAENIPDKCAGNSVGLLVDLDLLGTPPFQVSYNIRLEGGSVTPRVAKIDRLHSQLELKPSHAGHYTYEFTDVSDAVYHEGISLRDKRMILEQDVRPPAAARIFDGEAIRKACIEEPVAIAVQMMGQPPYVLEYELVHRGRRQKYTLPDISTSMYMLHTKPLDDGGEYTLALISITDQSGCKSYLKAEAKILVGMQRPRAAFGMLEGKRSVSALEAKRVALPMRLQGEAPWELTYRNAVNGVMHVITLHDSNDHLETVDEGTYEILDIKDVSCPGTVDPKADQFAVNWIPRPSVAVADSPLVHFEKGRYIKAEICEGDEDHTDVTFTGTAPFDFEYEQRHKPDRGSQSMGLKKLSAGLHSASLRMDASEAGTYEYKISKLGDLSYKHDQRRFNPVIIQQRVHPRPSATFSEPGRTYRYCKEEDAGGEVVPISLIGSPPFHLELEIKHHAIPKPELINVPNVESMRYNLHLPHRVLALGTHSVTIRKVRDAHGCQCRMDINAPHIQVSVADIPSISPLEAESDYCVGDRISYTLAGTPPFHVFYNFQDQDRKASIPSTDFRRIAEKPGRFVITAISDQRSTDACKAKVNIEKVIHEMPSVRVSKGRTAVVDIHEGGVAEILFEFGGSPPFHFT